jgi:hypothetical protein
MERKMKKLFHLLMITGMTMGLLPLHGAADSEISISPITNKQPGDTLTISGQSTLPEVTIKVFQPDQSLLFFDSIKPVSGYFSDTISLPSNTSIGSYSIKAGAGSQLATQAFTVVQNQSQNGNSGNPTSQNVGISVTGYNGQSILSSKELSFMSGDTPYSVLVRALGSSQVTATGTGSGLYVSSINGLAQFDHGAKSGWMCSVNGTYLAQSAGSYHLQPGDVIAWNYTVDLGTDIGAPSGSSSVPSQPTSTTQAVNDALKSVNLSADNTQPLNQIAKSVAILNADQRMTEQDVKQLASLLNENQVNLSQTIDPTQQQVLSDTIHEVTLEIPVQALNAPSTIQIQKLPDNVYNFLPNGTHFDKPVTISIKVPLSTEDLSQLALCWLDEQSNQWIPIPAVIDAKTGIITGQVTHFTKFAVVNRIELGNSTGVDVSSAIESASKQLISSSDLSDWSAFALFRSGKALPAGYLDTVPQQLKENQGTFRNITDYQRMVLGVIAAGGDPTNIAGYNLIEKIYNNDRMTLQGTNGVIFSLIALDSRNYSTPADAKWNRDTLLSWMLSAQNTDGGWPLVAGDQSLVDLTSMALTALAPYQDRHEIKAAIDKAVAWLSQKQTTNGGYIENGEQAENSESVAQVIEGLSAIGVNPTGTQFTKTNGNLVTNLLGFQLPSGAFSHNKGQEPNQMATEQALAALVAYDYYGKGKGSIYRFNFDASQQAYTDINEVSDWAKEFVIKARNYGVMAGVGTTHPEFAPKRVLTRAEFAKIMVSLLGEKPNPSAPQVFDDVDPNSWYYGDVTKARELGIIHGVTDTTFAPNEKITREQMAIMINNALKLSEAKSSISFSDLSTAHQDAVSSIQSVAAAGIMEGYNQTFDPLGQVTREMAAIISVKIYERKHP